MKILRRNWAALCLGLLFFVCGPAAIQAGETKTFDVAIADGQVQGGTASIRVSQNDRVVIRWRADHETDIHLHGYDLKATLSPDAMTELEFEAHATGRFPITSHGHHGDGHDEPVLLHVEVYPD